MVNQKTHILRFKPGVSQDRKLQIQGRLIANLAGGNRGAKSLGIQSRALNLVNRGMAISQLAAQSLKNESVRHRAESVIENIPINEQLQEIAAIQSYVQDNVRYTLDPYGVEKFTSPEALLENPYGDCDDMAGLFAGMVSSIGYPSAVIVTGVNGYQHVIGGVSPLYGPIPQNLPRINGKWIPVEVTKSVPLGWVNKNWNRFRVFEI